MDVPKLIVLGNVNLDLGLGPIRAWPASGTEVMGERAVYRPGGSAGNAALAAAAQGVGVELHADLGDDALGDWLLAALRRAGIDCTYVRQKTAQTAFSFGVLHPDGERTFFSLPGHLETQGVGETSAILSAAAGSVVLASGYYLLPRWREGLADVFAACKSRGLTTALDTGWPPDGRFEADALQPILEQTDLFLPNAAEAQTLVEVMGAEEGKATPARSFQRVSGGRQEAGRMREIVRRLAEWVRVPVVKDGSDGAWGLDGGEIVHESTEPVAPEDTIGAGDTFNAAFIKAFLLERSGMEYALEYANAAARLAITFRGPVRRYPTSDEIESEISRGRVRKGA